MSSVNKSVTITEEQDKWLNDRSIMLSRFMQKKIKEEMEGSTLKPFTIMVRDELHSLIMNARHDLTTRYNEKFYKRLLQEVTDHSEGGSF